MGDPNVFWAAFGGGAAAGVFTLVAVCVAEWLRWFLDRPLLKVEAYVGDIAPSSDGTSLVCLRGKRFGHNYVIFTATNPHTKPVTVKSFGLEYKRKQWGKLVVFPQEGYVFPYKIEGQTLLGQWLAVTELTKCLQHKERRPSDLKWVWFESSAGKVFRSKIDSKMIETLEEACRSVSAVVEDVK